MITNGTTVATKNVLIISLGDFAWWAGTLIRLVTERFAVTSQASLNVLDVNMYGAGC